MLPPAQSAKTEAFYDLTELKKAKFQLLFDKRGIIELKKASLINYDMYYRWQTIWERSWAVKGGSFPLPPPVDRTLYAVPLACTLYIE